jgi:serralysin
LRQHGILLATKGAMVAPPRREDTTMAFVYGTSNAETLNALDGITNSADKIFGLAGNDRIYGLGGNDEILGGHGADHIDGGSGIDTASYIDSGTRVSVDLRSGQGRYGTAEGDTLVSIENLTGSAYNDNLTGNDGANVLRGLGGYDIILGYGGNDTIYGGDLGDSLVGQDGEDDLHGDAGNDGLDGGAGNDILHGGTDRDKLIGASGGDRFVWAVVEDTGVDEHTADEVVDFTFGEGDRIDVAGIDANLVASGNQAFTFIGSAALSGTPGEINFVHSGGDTLIQLQTGTSADPEAVILLPGIHTPEASWFVL